MPTEDDDQIEEAPEETVADEPEVTEAPAAPPAAPSGDQPPAPEAAAPAAPAADTTKTVLLPTSALGRIKKEEREKGRREALLVKARDLGFASIEAFEAAMAGYKASAQPKRVAAPPAPDPEEAGDGDPGPAPQGMSAKAARAWEKEREKIVRERDAFKQRLAQSERRERALRKEMDDKDTRNSLREAAIEAGISPKHASFAVHLFNDFVDGKSEKDLAGWNEAKIAEWFGERRGDYPYLFGESVRPAQTAARTATPPAPKPGDVARNGAENGKVDARKMKPEEFRELLRKRGLNPSSV